MKRIRLKKQIKITPLTYISMLLLFLTISIIAIFIMIGKNITPKIQKYAEKQAKKITSIVISKTSTFENVNIDNLFVTDKSSDGTINSIDFNPVIINQILSNVSNNTKNYLKKLEHGQIKELGLSDNSLFNVDESELKKGIIYEVPTGIIFNNGLLANIGPKIPVKLDLIGDIVTDVITTTKNYGINNAIIEISIKITITEQVILPYDTSEIKVTTNIPVAIKMVQGIVPNYYFNGKDNPSLSVDTN